MPGFYTTMGRASNYVGSTLTKIGAGLSAAGGYAKGAWMGAIGGVGAGGLSKAGKTGYIHGTEFAAGAGWGGHMAQRYGARGYDFAASGGARAGLGKMHGAVGGALGTTGRNVAYGAMAGAGWGMVSDDTSVLGGAAMGAGLGAVGGRYGGAGYGAYKKARGFTSAIGWQAAGRGGGQVASNYSSGEAMRHALRRVRRKVSLDANRAVNAVGSTLSRRMA